MHFIQDCTDALVLRYADDDWDKLTICQKAAQLPDIPLDDNWGVRESILQEEEPTDNPGMDRQYDVTSDTSANMHWSDNPAPAWQDM